MALEHVFSLATSDELQIAQPDFTVSGDHSGEDPPDYIPNSEVKLSSADGTLRETVWESRTSPGFI